METLVVFLSLILIMAAIIPVIKLEHWWIRVFDFIRLQAFVISLIVLAIGMIYMESSTLKFVTLGALLISAISQAIQIYPYTILAKKQVVACKTPDSRNMVSLFVSNVLMYNSKTEGVKQQIAEAEPDMILMLETNEYWAKSMSYLKEKYPYTVECPLENTYGMLFYSKLELSGTELRFIISDEIPSIFTKVKTPSGKEFDFYGIHPKPPVPQESESSLERDTELILVGKEIAKRKKPSVVAGDLNDVAWSYTTRLFQKTGNLRDPRKGRGFFSTYHANYWFFRWPLDHIFHTDSFDLVHMERMNNIGSDHFPINVILNYTDPLEKEFIKNELNEEEKEDVEDKLEAIEEVMEEQK
ncbi:endonuclease/exonuclease/phosphatase family protein [Chondrinema litorale]|uniref:endonuclease/exonuclease/phosphatase family protein n=1 Tax=Chondrinema litorale TaxID=2994555 RepID=UPI002542EB13|nr:endonuclease/exonuclease/phosphatase family protein [Chondrinema litorale]UZR98875.1 endonuclease/exonuclease/phosphatase family protein [Chondrinema litorale]